MARPPVVAAGVPRQGGVHTGWAGAPLIALLMILVIAVRLHELVPGLSVLKPALLATFGGLGLIWIKSPPPARSAVLRSPLVRVALALWTFIILTIPLALWPRLAFDTAQAFMTVVALLIAILLCAPQQRTLVRLQTGFVFGAAAYALYAKLFGRVSWEGRLTAGVGMYDSNDMAALLALALPLSLALLRGHRGVMRMVIICTAALLVLVVLASGSRGGVLGLGAGAVVFVLGMKGSRRVTAMTVLAAAVAVTWTFSPDFQKRMTSLTNLEEDYNTFDEYGRKEVWKRGGQYFRENPVIGVGAGNFPIAEGNYFGVLYSGVRGAKWSNAHNSYIQAFVELGFIGGSLFILILVLGARRALKLWRGVRVRSGVWLHQPEFLAALSAYLVSGTFLSHTYFMPLFALLGLIGLADWSRAAAQRAGQAVAGGAARDPDEAAMWAGVGSVPRRTGGYRFRGGLA